MRRKLKIRSHGRRGYTVHGCRCKICTAANTKEKRRQRLRSHKTTLNNDDPRHGTRAGYFDFGCRCERCGEAGIYCRNIWWTRKRFKREVHDSHTPEYRQYVDPTLCYCISCNELLFDIEDGLTQIAKEVCSAGIGVGPIP